MRSRVRRLTHTAPSFLIVARISLGMESVRKGIRSGDIEKDTYERLVCAECDEVLTSTNDPDEIGTVRTCPECGAEWKEVG